MEQTFSKKFTYFQFLKFVAPAVISMVFLSIYTIIDGIFVAQLVGPDALASINIILPAFSLIFGIGIMLATGGSAITSIKLGERKVNDANKTFSLIIYVSLFLGIILSLIGLLFSKNIALLLGATETLLPYAEIYGKIIILFSPVFIIKALFEFFIRTDGDFKFSLTLSIIGGVINILLDYIFIKWFNLGIAGAALATGLGVLVSSLLGLWYFLSNKSTLKFTKLEFNFKILSETIINGSSEMVAELSTGITTLLFNTLALKYAGENGLAALTIVLYGQFLMVSTYLGFATGTAPLFSYNFGAQNYRKLRETFDYSKKFIYSSSIIIFILSVFCAPIIIKIFVPVSSPVYILSLTGLKLFSISFLFVGINIFASGLFTALSNGKISAIISFSRAFIFIIIGSFILPPLLELNGLWLIVPFAEILSIGVSFFYLNKIAKPILKI